VKPASAEVRPGWYCHRSRVHTIPGVALAHKLDPVLPWVFQFIGSEVYNIVDKMFPLLLLLKAGYVWFRRRSLLLYGISGSRLRPILDRWGGSAGAGRLMLLLVYDCF